MPGEFNPYLSWLGIPEGEHPPNDYQLLGLRLFEDQLDAIRQAAEERTALLFRIQPGPYALEYRRLLKEISAAKVRLLNESDKEVYDRKLRRDLQARKPTVSGQPAGEVLWVEPRTPAGGWQVPAEPKTPDSARSTARGWPSGPASRTVPGAPAAPPFLPSVSPLEPGAFRPASLAAPQDSAPAGADGGPLGATPVAGTTPLGPPADAGPPVPEGASPIAQIAEPVEVPVIDATTPPEAAVAAETPTETRDRADNDQATAAWSGLGQLGEYRLLEKRGEGGMGTVYKAIHTKLGRIVALKVLPQDRAWDAHAIARFEREMRAVGALDHPNIVRAMDAREVDGTWFLVMEFVEGMDLANVGRRCHPIPEADACEVIRQAALGLASAHQQGLVHRDIKPSNLMLAPHGIVKVLDLGVARFQADVGPVEELTSATALVGTYEYMAPEQILDSRHVDIRADIYSLGCTLFRLLAGRPPFGGTDYQGTMERLAGHLRDEAPPIQKFRPDATAALQKLLSRMLAKDPQQRFSTPGELAEVIAPLSAGANLTLLLARARGETPLAAEEPAADLSKPVPGAQEPSLPPRAWGKRLPPWARRAMPFAIVAAVALLIAIVLGTLTGGRPPVNDSSDEAASSGETTDPAKEQDVATPAPTRPSVVLTLPATQRSRVRLEIDGQWQDLAGLESDESDAVRLTLDEGDHTLRLTRLGYEPFERYFQMGKEDLAIEPVWRPIEPVAAASVPDTRPEADPTATPAAPSTPEVASPAPPTGPATPPPEMETAPSLAEIEAAEQVPPAPAEYDDAMKPVEAMVADWDFAGALAASEQLSFAGEESKALWAARREEIRRMAALKQRMITRINEAYPHLKKGALAIRGINGDLTKADQQAIETLTISGKAERLPWTDLGSKAAQKLLQLIVDPENPDDWQAAGSVALAAKDMAYAEQCAARARELGASESQSPSLVRGAFGRVKTLLAKGDYNQAEKMLDGLVAKYGKTAWQAANEKTVEMTRRAIRVGRREAAAEKLYLQAVDEYQRGSLFDLKPSLARLKTEFAQSQPLVDASRRPSLAEMEAAVAELGQLITVRRDGKGDYQSIQEAVNAAPRNSLVEIHDAGPFSEKLLIPSDKEGLTIRGKPGLWPVISSIGAANNFNTLVEVSAPRVTLERLALLHGFVGGPGPCCVRGDATIRASIVYVSSSGQAHQANPDSKLENSVVFGECRNHRLVRNSVIFSNYYGVSAGARLDNVLFVNMANQLVLEAGAQMQFCTVPAHVRLTDRDCSVADCILPSIEAFRPGCRIEHCNLYGTQPVFVDQARPGKGCVGLKPQFADPKSYDFRLLPTSPCRRIASDGGDIGFRYNPAIIEILRLAFALRQQGLITF